MARRKKRGASFGAPRGSKSQTVQRDRERKRFGLYALAGVFALVLLCLIIAWSFRDTGSSSTVDSTSTDSVVDEGFDLDDADAGDNEFEASAETLTEDDIVDDSDGFTSDSISADFDESAFELLEGNYALTELDPIDRNDFYDSYPEYIIDESLTYDAVIATVLGDIRIRLYDDEAPLTVNNFVSLALDGFYDGTTFHRVIEDFMAQAGDPTGTGTGGPGYNFEDEVDTGFSFDRPGLLAMANAGPGTNGSQFFITTAATPWLDGNHTIFGEVVSGDDILYAIRLRDPGSDPNPGDLIEAVDIYVAVE